jgi:hypothetical protein
VHRLEKLRADGAGVTARRLKSQIDVPLLTARPGYFLRARVQTQDIGRELPNGDLITAEDVGKFWFVEGYSRVGGPDILRPDED